MTSIQLLLTDIDVLLKRKENINSLLTLLDENKSLKLRHVNSLTDNEKKYLEPFNFQWKDSSSFIDPVLQFIFPFFVKLGLLGKPGYYTGIISSILVAETTDRKNDIKNNFHLNVMEDFYTGKFMGNKWTYKAGGDSKHLFNDFLEKFIEENVNIESNIYPYEIFSDLSKSNDYRGNIHLGQNIYEDIFKNLFLDVNQEYIIRKKIIFSKFLFLIEFLTCHDDTLRNIKIHKDLDFGKFGYKLFGVACHCQTYTERNDKWYFIRDCNYKKIILNENEHIFFKNGILKLVDNQEADYPQIIGYELSTNNPDEMTIDTTNQNDYILIKNLFKDKFNMEVN